MKSQILSLLFALTSIAGAQVIDPTPDIPAQPQPWKKTFSSREGVEPTVFSTFDRKVDLGPVFGVPNRSKGVGKNEDAYYPPSDTVSTTGEVRDFSDWTSGVDAYQLIRNFSDTLTTTLAPPDNHCAVGGEWIVQAVNSQWAIYDKCGNREFTETYATTLSDTTNFLFDPKVIFDPWSKRWFMLILKKNTAAQTSGITVMVSDDSNPHGTWWSYTFNGVLSTGAAKDWADYYDLGYGQLAVYISGNHFRWSNGALTGGAGWILNKSQLLDGQTVNWTRYFPLADIDGNLMFGPRSAHMMSVFGTTDGIFASTVHSGGNSNLFYSKISDPLGAATLTKKKIDIGTYNRTPGMQQPGGQLINGVNGEDCRLLQAIVANDTVNGSGVHFYSSIHSNHRWDGDTADRAIVRIINVDPIADSKRFATSFGAPSRHYFYSAIAPDYRGQAFIAFGRCGIAANEFAELRFTSVEGGAIQNSDRILAGGGNYTRLTNGVIRFGDYFGANLDWGDFDKGTPAGTAGRHRMWGFGQVSTTNVNNWVNATGGVVINSTPASMFVSAPANVVWRRTQGAAGAGGFPSQAYTISMTGEVGFNWEVVNVPNWITVTPQKGELFRGQTKVVTATVNANANSLAFGRHTATLRFRNCYTGGIVERVFELSIGKWVDCIGIIELQGFLITGDHTDLVTADNVYARMISDNTICHMKFTFSGLIDGGERIYCYQETSVGRPGLVEETYLWNFSTNGWNYVASRSATISDQGYYSINYLAADPYINSASYSHVALRWLPINDEDPSLDGWEHRVDQMRLFEYP